jgi:hypothetical protein
MQDSENPFEDHEDESLFSDMDLGPDSDESFSEESELELDDSAFDDSEDPIFSDDLLDDDDDDDDAEYLDLYNLDSPVPHITSSRLSKTRFNELNLGLVMNNLPLVNVLSNDDVYNIMFASMGNSQKVNPYDDDSHLSAKFAKLITSQNLSISTSELPISFKPAFFPEIDALDLDDYDNSYFGDIIDLEQITSGSFTYKACCCTAEYCTPGQLIPPNTYSAIKKVFAFELLREELSERVDIQHNLTTTIIEYESTLLKLYDSITSIKALKSKSYEDDIITLKIGIMHMALEAEGFENLFVQKIVEDGRFRKIENIKQLKKSVLAHEKSSKKKISLRRAKVNDSFFKNTNDSSFEVFGTTTDQFEEDIKARKKQLDTLISSPKPFF